MDDDSVSERQSSFSCTRSRLYLGLFAVVALLGMWMEVDSGALWALQVGVEWRAGSVKNARYELYVMPGEQVRLVMVQPEGVAQRHLNQSRGVGKVQSQTKDGVTMTVVMVDREDLDLTPQKAPFWVSLGSIFALLNISAWLLVTLVVASVVWSCAFGRKPFVQRDETEVFQGMGYSLMNAAPQQVMAPGAAQRWAKTWAKFPGLLSVLLAIVVWGCLCGAIYQTTMLIKKLEDPVVSTLFTTLHPGLSWNITVPIQGGCAHFLESTTKFHGSAASVKTDASNSSLDVSLASGPESGFYYMFLVLSSVTAIIVGVSLQGLKRMVAYDDLEHELLPSSIFGN